MISALQQSPPVPHLEGYGLSYSPFLCYVGSTLQKVHKIWQYYIRGEKLANPDNWLGLALGHLADYSFGNKLSGQILMAPFLVTARFLDLFEQEDRLAASFRNWNEALKCAKPLLYNHHLEHPSKINILISRHRITRWKQTSSHLMMRIDRISRAGFDLIRQAFCLIMRFMDVLDLFTMDSAKMEKNLRKGVQEGGLNIPRVLRTLCNNQQNFLSRLEKIESIIDRLSGDQKNKPSKKIVETSRHLFRLTEKGLNYYSSKSAAIGEVITTLLKSMLFQITPVAYEKYVRENIFDPSAPNCLKFDEVKQTSQITPKNLISINSSTPKIEPPFNIKFDSV